MIRNLGNKLIIFVNFCLPLGVVDFSGSVAGEGLAVGNVTTPGPNVITRWPSPGRLWPGVNGWPMQV